MFITITRQNGTRSAIALDTISRVDESINGCAVHTTDESFMALEDFDALFDKLNPDLFSVDLDIEADEEAAAEGVVD